MKATYTFEIKQFINLNYKNISTLELTNLINTKFNSEFSASQIKSYKSNHKLKSNFKDVKNYNKLFYDYHIDFIKKHAKGTSNQDLTNLFNNYFKSRFTVQQIKAVKLRNKIKSGLTGHYQKGNIPLNKGKKWDEFMSKEGQANSRKTTFKKGDKPFNTAKIMAEVEREDGYLYRKIKDTNYPGLSRYNWKAVHHIIYEEKHGKIPESHKIVFADGNKKNFDINNLILVSNSQLLILNKKGLITSDPEITKIGVNTAKVIDKINNLNKRKNKR